MTEQEAMRPSDQRLTWEQRKQIGEALGWSVNDEKAKGTVFVLTQGEAFWNVYPTEQAAWDAYQPDVLNEVIPWLEKNTDSPDFEYQGDCWRAEAVPWLRGIGPTFAEAVCALMLDVLESGVTP